MKLSPEAPAIVLGTRNPAKRIHYSRLLAPLGRRLVLPEEVGIVGWPDEAGATAEQNANTKASFYAKAGLSAFAEDEVLLVDFLPMDAQPGVNGRSLGSITEANDDELLRYWVEIIAKVPEGKRTGRWHVAHCLALPEDRTETLSRDYPVRFFLPRSETRLPGWPLSSIKGRVSLGKPHSEASEEELARINEEENTAILQWLRQLLANLPQSSKR